MSVNTFCSKPPSFALSRPWLTPLISLPLRINPDLSPPCHTVSTMLHLQASRHRPQGEQRGGKVSHQRGPQVQN